MVYQQSGVSVISSNHLRRLACFVCVCVCVTMCVFGVCDYFCVFVCVCVCNPLYVLVCVFV